MSTTARDVQANGAAPTRPLSVERRSNLSYEEFAGRYLRAGRPVVLTDAIKGWSATGKWTPEFLKTSHGSKALEIDGRNYELGELVDLILASSSAEPAPYLRAQKLAEVLPELVADIEPTPDFSRDNWTESRLMPSQIRRAAMPEILFGGEGASFHVLHYDKNHLHAFISQLYGQKEFFVYGPEQTEYVYPKESTPNQSEVDVHNPDYERFPLFAHAEPIRVTVEPGETIFVPGGWWHTTLMPSTSISITWNLANASNWSEFTRDNQVRLKKSGVPFLPAAFGLYSKCFARTRGSKTE